jgi:hypothetical protein
MNNPLVHAFFIGRAIAEAVSEQVEMGVTNALSELGKFDAEQRERLRQFTEVVVRAQRAEEMSMQGRSAAGSSSPAAGTGGTDLQATIDDLRAETAQLRAELQRYRSSL